MSENDFDIERLKKEGAKLHLRNKAEAKTWEVHKRLKQFIENNFYNHQAKLDEYMKELQTIKLLLSESEK